MSARKISKLKSYDHLIDRNLLVGAQWEDILICNELSPSEVLNLGIESQFAHVCQESHPHFPQELNSAVCLAKSPSLFLQFPIATILSPECVNEKSENQFKKFDFKFSHANQKGTLLHGAESLLSSLNSSSSIQADALILIDELATNALYNAPFVDMANTKSGVSRKKTDVQMKSGYHADVFVGASESRIVIGCRDPYGTLNLKKYFSGIKKCYDSGVAKNMNMSEQGGAGIGSYMIFHAIDSFYSVVLEGQSTLICCVMPRRMSSKGREMLPKNLHYYIKK